jgi:FMN phosphatase YigB (HAD superfamily)
VSYYSRSEWPGVLEQAVGEVAGYLCGRGLLRVEAKELPARVEAERGEREDHRVRPLEGRLVRIFQLTQADLAPGDAMDMCRRFMRPIFALGRMYDDALPTLHALRGRGLRTAILSNTPWGSPAELWRPELARHGLAGTVDAAAFCRDAGYRKPARQAFEHVCRELGAAAGQCLFVGDDPRWDLLGPRRIGMDALLIDRRGSAELAGEEPIHNLRELLGRL